MLTSKITKKWKLLTSCSQTFVGQEHDQHADNYVGQGGQSRTASQVEAVADVALLIYRLDVGDGL
jgi:hypothetical protein